MTRQFSGCGIGIVVLGLAFCLFGCASGPGASGGMTAGQGAGGPWWMQQTALTRDGRLGLRNRTWWQQAMQLAVGQRFLIEAEGEAAGHMLVRRERFRNRTRASCMSERSESLPRWPP